MRKQFVKTIENIILKNKKIFIILGDIGVFGFRKIFKNKPNQILNIGILEQSTISFASGLAKIGFIPVVHTIATFLIERAFEQIKIDFGYQKLPGNLVSIGASYDYAAMGCTHHCPADVNLMKNIPNTEIIVPGTSEEFNILFKSNYMNKKLTYFRLSEYENNVSFKVKFAKANVIKKGKKATIIAVGPVLNLLSKITDKYDVNLIYYTTIAPFDYKTLDKIIKKKEKILIIEPFYQGSILTEIFKIKNNNFCKIDTISVPLNFIHNYGTKENIDKSIGFNEKNIEKKIKELIYDKAK
ncbi:hypothetical protein OAO20_04585 [Candidatus Pelagibacter ubique]|nr:hypothetical protein [Candidatus Pelagibacter ubique]